MKLHELKVGDRLDLEIDTCTVVKVGNDRIQVRDVIGTDWCGPYGVAGYHVWRAGEYIGILEE